MGLDFRPTPKKTSPCGCFELSLREGLPIPESSFLLNNNDQQ